MNRSAAVLKASRASVARFKARQWVGSILSPSNEMDTQLAIITGLGQVQAAPNGGRALKDAALTALVETAFQVTAATRAYAIVNKDAELAAQLDYSPSDLGRERAQEVVARCRNVWSAATDNQQASVSFGVTTAKLTNLKKKIDEYDAAHPRPREGRASAKAATKALPDAFAQVDEILNDCLDGLMVQFKDSAAEFYNEYTVVRRIQDVPGSRPRKPAPAPAPTPA
jgi:hypothetical protein